MHKKISNQRKDFHFKLANKICSEYALICIEDLNIKGMQKRWGRKISDYGFSEFIKILEYKAREIGSIVQKIDRYYPSSQICHVCGTKNPETKNLAVREWICEKCKTSHDRDRMLLKIYGRLGHQPSLERYSKTCYFSRQVSFVSKNPLPLGMGSMSILYIP